MENAREFISFIANMKFNYKVSLCQSPKNHEWVAKINQSTLSNRGKYPLAREKGGKPVSEGIYGVCMERLRKS